MVTGTPSDCIASKSLPQTLLLCSRPCTLPPMGGLALAAQGRLSSAASVTAQAVRLIWVNPNETDLST